MILRANTNLLLTATCRSALWSQLNVLSERIASLRRAATAASSECAVLDLAEATRVCESVRLASITALVDQYQRIAFGRPIPKTLAVPKPRIRLRQSQIRRVVKEEVDENSDEETGKQRQALNHRPRWGRNRVTSTHSEQGRARDVGEETLSCHGSDRSEPSEECALSIGSSTNACDVTGEISRSNDDDENYDKGQTSSRRDENGDGTRPANGILPFQSEPPSPPLTPKTLPSSPERTSLPTQGSQLPSPNDTSSEQLDEVPLLHPKNTVFAVFCPNAMGLQIDGRQAVPGEENCVCGHLWKPTNATDPDLMTLKDGFRLTRRFLAKSHLGGQENYGCTLCTSNGKTERYAGVANLREHINTGHTKWQLLHDPDLGASSMKGVIGFS